MFRLSGWRPRWRAWWDRRHPRTDTLRLGHRNLYIVPTGSGLVYGVLLGCLLLASINYQLNLGHLLTFTLSSAALVALHATHATLSGLRLRAQVGEAGFVGETVDLEIAWQDETRLSGWRHPAHLGRHGLVLRWRDEPAGRPVDVSPDPDAVLHLPRRLAHRGRQTLPALELGSRFPLGLFRVWAVWRIAQQPLAWPAPERDGPPLPLADSSDPADAPLRRHALQPKPAEDEGVRPWRREDRPAQVLWRRSARSLAAGGGLLVRDPPPARQTRGLHLDGDRLTSLDPEARLRRLSTWVLQAEALGQPYRLSLGTLSIAEGTGPLHQRQCLDALALWSPP